MHLLWLLGLLRCHLFRLVDVLPCVDRFGWSGGWGLYN